MREIASPDKRTHRIIRSADQPVDAGCDRGEQAGTYEGARLSSYYEPTKRAFDVLLALVALILLLPLLIAIAVAVRLNSRGPILLRQVRLGRGGRPFPLYKFRTMRVGSEELSPELVARNESNGPLFKMRHDPRVTGVGRLLRRFSMDELPQLLNILLGQMSFVGPRPPLLRELAGYSREQRLRLRVVPGLTGLWQISGRSHLPFEEMVRLDLMYIERRSLTFDLWILWKTIPVVLRGHGAY